MAGVVELCFDVLLLSILGGLMQSINSLPLGDVTDILTHWGLVTHICVSKLIIIGSDNGLSPERRQAIIWANAGILLIGPLGTNFSENLIEIQTFSLKKIRLKMSSVKCCSFRLGLNVLKVQLLNIYYELSSWAFLMKLLSGECQWTHCGFKSTLVQVMASCHQATNHYLASYGVTRLQWINIYSSL